jgi:hypothetical protein
MKEVTEKRGRRCNELLNKLNEKKECRKLKAEAIDRTLWKTRFGRGCGPFLRENAG